MPSRKRRGSHCRRRRFHFLFKGTYCPVLNFVCNNCCRFLNPLGPHLPYKPTPENLLVFRNFPGRVKLRLEEHPFSPHLRPNFPVKLRL